MFDIIVKFIIIAFTCLGTLFANSNQFVDSQIMPKWFMMFGGILLLASYCIIKFLLCPNGTAKNSKNIEPYIIGAIIITTSCQALYGILQYFYILPSTSNFQVTGSFDNPAGFAASLCTAFPFYILAFIKSKRYLRWSISCMSVFVVAAILLSESRAGILSLIVILLCFGIQRLKLFSKIKWILLPLLLIGIVIGLYFMKKDSADGRLLIWKCSLSMMKEKWLAGYGMGGFEAHYMDYQADYLRSHPDSSYNQLADTVQYPFCEYLNIGINYGLAGLLIVGALIITLIYAYHKNPSSNKKAALFCWLSVAVFASFSYPLMYPFVWVVLLFSTYILLKDNVQKRLSHIPILVKKVGATISICLFVYIGCQIYQRAKAELVWKQAINLSSLGKKEVSFSLYKEIQHKLRSDRYFLYNYSVELFHAERYEESLFIALQCHKYWADYDLEMLLGQLYEQLQQFPKSKKKYRQASFMCPSRFLPLYRLVVLLKKQKRNDEAQEMARTIVNKTIKVPSQTVYRIKKEMKEQVIHLQ